MAASPETIVKLHERQRSERLRNWRAQIGQVEALIDKGIEEEGGTLKAEKEEGRLRHTYTFRLPEHDVVDAVGESSIAMDELRRRYRGAGFEGLTLLSEGLSGAIVELVAYDDSDETEDQRLTRLLAEALRQQAGE